MIAKQAIKPVVWIGSTKDDLMACPPDVVAAIGYALYEAQKGNKHPSAKPMHGYGGAGVLEVIENQDGDTFRAVYTVRLQGIVYVLHVFQKKSTIGIKTPKGELVTINVRLKRAEQQHAAWRAELERKAGR